MSNKIIRTNERCAICDFGRAVEEGEEFPSAENTAPSIYLDGLTNGPDGYDPDLHKTRWYQLYQNAIGRFVFIDPRDGKPICTQCAEEAIVSVEEMKYEDRGFKPLTWEGESEETWNERGFSFVSHPDESVIVEDLEDLEEHILNLDILDDSEIDWDQIERWDNGNIKFPLPKKPVKHELTDEHRRQIEEIKAKGQVKQCKPGVARGIGGREYYLRTPASGTIDDHWQPLPDKPRLAKTSDWPKRKASD